jgi:hypothetical protein
VFPSWSWAGWEGKLPDNFLRHAYGGCNCPCDNSSVNIGAVSEAGQHISWTDVVLLLHTRSENAANQPQVLQLAANTVELQLSHFIESTRFLTPGYYVTHHTGRVCVDGAILKDCTIYAPVRLNDPREHGLRCVGAHKFLCAIIGCSEAKTETDMLMLNQLEEEVFERIGTVSLRSGFTFVGELLGLEGGVTRVNTWGVKPARNASGYTTYGSTCSRGDIGQRVAVVSRKASIDQWDLKKLWRTLSIA